MLMRRCSSEVEPSWFWMQTSAACRNRGSRSPPPCSPLPPPASAAFSASSSAATCSPMLDPAGAAAAACALYQSMRRTRSEEHTSELQSPCNLVCRLLLEKKKKTEIEYSIM